MSVCAGQVVLVAAVGRHGELSRGPTMLWDLPDDWQHFNDSLQGRVVVMGSPTARVLGEPLPGARNLVLTRSGLAPAGFEAVASPAQAIAAAASTGLIVGGGGAVYAAFLPWATDLWLTHIEASFPDATVFFPDVDPSDWRVVEVKRHPADPRHAQAFNIVRWHRTTNACASSLRRATTAP